MTAIIKPIQIIQFLIQKFIFTIGTKDFDNTKIQNNKICYFT